MLKFSQKKRSSPTIKLTALIDIVFLLLIFFLLASNFVTQQGISIIVPEVESKDEKISTELVINIDSSGMLYFGNNLVDLEQLFKLLQSQIESLSIDTVIIQADRRVEYDSVIQAIDVAKLAGAKNLLLVTEQKKK